MQVITNPKSFPIKAWIDGVQLEDQARTQIENVAKMPFIFKHVAAEGVECRKDIDVIDETPGAYKDIDAVMAAQSDLVEIVHTLHQIICVKG